MLLKLFKLLQDNGAYVKGVFMEGARWCRQKKTMAESLPKILFDPMPIVSLMLVAVKVTLENRAGVAAKLNPPPD